MKVCPNCHNAVEDGVLFCDKCGTKVDAQNSVQNGYVQQPVNNVNYAQPTYNYGVNQQPYQPAPQPQPKKNNTGLIVGIVVAALLVLAGIGFAAEKIFQSQGYGSSDDTKPSYTSGDSDNTSTTADNVTENQTTTTKNNDANSYDKGSFADGVYVNNWANLRCEAGTIWTHGGADEYAAYEADPNTECGVILNDTANGKQLVICFEKLTGASIFINEKGYLDVVSDSLKEEYAGMNINVEMSEYYDTTIAGEKYKTVRINFVGTTVVQDIHVRKLDNYIIFIGVTSQSNFDAAAVVNNIRTAK